MTFVDSSVWIAHLRGTVSGPVKVLRGLRDARMVLVGDVVLAEVLKGARNEAQASLIEAELRQFDVARVLDDRIAVQSARNFRLLRRHGVTIRTTIDIIIGTYCIEHDYALLQQDRDFIPMPTHLGLRLVAAG